MPSRSCCPTRRVQRRRCREEAEAALASVDAEFGRTTDPVRMYMREMGTVELLTRQGEIEIAKRIEDGLNQVKCHMAHFPPTIELLLEVADRSWRRNPHAGFRGRLHRSERTG